MIIKKILNNNVIITENKSGREMVAMGRGIAFKKRRAILSPTPKFKKLIFSPIQT